MPEIVVHVAIPVRPDRVAEFLALAADHARASRAEPGCLCFEVLRDLAVPLRFALHERWRDMDAYQAHRHTDHYAHWRQRIVGLESMPRSHADYVPALPPVLVFANGCFDGLHAGHVHLLAEARRLGDVLVVAVNDDDSVRRLKGPGRPVHPLADRVAVLRALRCVDQVLTFASEDELEQLVEQTRPAVLVKGSDHRVDAVIPGAEFAGRGRVHFVERLPGVSTSAILDRILVGKRSTKSEERSAKNAFV